MINHKVLFFMIIICSVSSAAKPLFAESYDIKTYGAVGDGITLDTDAINKTIDAASAAGGGTVFFPAGTYLSYSIHLQSNISLYLDQGATLIGAETSEEGVGYDPPEPNEWGDVYKYQDFGHSHWHNSLIWGENLENVSILGPGLIYGKGLSRSGGRPRNREQGNRQSGAQRPDSRDASNRERSRVPDNRRSRENDPVDLSRYTGYGNKAIALKNCRNVIIRDVSFLMGGHFCILATGVDNLTVDNLKMDTNRDAIDIDCCQHVRISNCTVNSPNDDAIVLKSSFALGYARATENVTITNCQVSGYDPGSFLDGTYKRTQEQAPDRGGVTGRIKFGTESNGGFKNITISNCVFDHCRGLALETVDGAILEDVTISNITMRDVTNAPFFLRLGRRMRGPEGTPIGKLCRINISDVVVHLVEPRYGALIMGIPGHEIEDLRMSNIKIIVTGGASKEQGAVEVPEMEDGYPDPRMFGDIPAYGFFIRHVNGLEMNNVDVCYLTEDQRPPFILDDVQDVTFNFLNAQTAPGIPTFILKNVTNFNLHQCSGIPDIINKTAVSETIY